MRIADINRQTGETTIALHLAIDSSEPSRIHTGIGFFDHMLTLFAKHGRFQLVLDVTGDLNVDSHHTIEDVGIVLGQAFKTALGNKQGIERYGQQLLPMDETLTQVALDLSGRAYLVFQADLTAPLLGKFDTEVVEDFFQSFTDNLQANIHINVLYGRNTHHKIESMFKGLGRALRQAVTLNPEIIGVNSTKGVI